MLSTDGTLISASAAPHCGDLHWEVFCGMQIRAMCYQKYLSLRFCWLLTTMTFTLMEPQNVDKRCWVNNWPTALESQRRVAFLCWQQKTATPLDVTTKWLYELTEVCDQTGARADKMLRKLSQKLSATMLDQVAGQQVFQPAVEWLQENNTGNTRPYWVSPMLCTFFAWPCLLSRKDEVS